MNYEDEKSPLCMYKGRELVFLVMDCQKRNDIITEGDKNVFTVSCKHCNKYKKDTLVKNGFTNQVNLFQSVCQK